MSTHLHEMTWEEVAHQQTLCDLALLPVGATEQHGPHMGCGMDSAIAEILCKDASSITETLCLPTMPYGCSIGHSKRWPGTIALNPKTLIDVITDIGDWVYASGFKRLLLVNGHVTNEAPLRCALEMLRARYDDMMIALVNTAQISQRVKQAHFDDADDWHANEAETSLMLAKHPELVRQDALSRADDPDRTNDCVFAHPVNRTSKNGVTGTPSSASEAKGQTLYAWMLEDFVSLINKAKTETPPLPYSYNESQHD